MQPGQTTGAVFLSYASQDAEAARRMGDALQTAGIEVWLDQSALRGGDAWDTEIRRRIRECTLFVPVISSHTEQRREGYFRLEWRLADQRTHMMAKGTPFLVPVVLDQTPEAGAHVPDSFVEVQWTRLHDEAAMRAFVARIRSLLEVAAGATDGSDAVSVAAGTMARGGVGAVPHRPWWRSWIAIGTAVVALALFVALRFNQLQSEARIQSIAVLPFTNVNADPDTEYQSDGLTERIIDQLSQLPGLKVTSHRAVFLFKGRDVDLEDVGRQLDVEAVLTGQVSTRNGTNTISLELVNAADNSHIWGARYVSPVSDLSGVQSRISLELARTLWPRLGGEVQGRLAKRQTVDTQAYEAYLRGREALRKFNQQDSRTAVSYFSESIRLDPDFALAYSGLADAYLFGAGTGTPASEANERAREAISKALTLDPALGEPRVSLAVLLMNEDWDFAGAEREFKRGIALSPSYVEGHHAYSHFLLAMGRIQESLVESQQVIALDPISRLGSGHMAYHNLYARQYDQAMQDYRAYLAREKADVAARHQFGEAHYQKGMWKEAVEEYVAALALSGVADSAIAELRTAFSRDGMPGYHRKRIEQLEAGEAAAYGPAGALPDRLYQIASAYARLGEKDLAFKWLETGYAQRVGALIHLREDFAFDNLRTDARFADLLRRIGLPPP